MRLRQPAQLDTRAILTAALDAKGESAWHRNPGPDGVWRWHASSLASCARQQILLRAAKEGREFKVETDPLETRLVFDLGHYYHGLMQSGLGLVDDYNLLGVELGGHHPTLPLAALADIVYAYQGEPLILEIKTESTYAGKHRRDESYLCEDNETMTAARKEHCLQVAAQAVVLEATVGIIERGWIVYVNKETGEHDQQPVVIGADLREFVVNRVNTLERLWAHYETDRLLPELLPDEKALDKRHKPPREYFRAPGLCLPRGDGDERGKYCRVRVECMTRAGRLKVEGAR